LDFAKKIGFDPCQVDNWRGKLAQLRAHGGASLLTKYGTMPQLLADTFPDLLARSVVRRSFWQDDAAGAQVVGTYLL